MLPAHAPLLAYIHSAMHAAPLTQVAEFLSHHPPFAGLGAAELEQIAAAAVLRSYRTGATVLIEDGTPAEALYVIGSGSMELLHEEEVIDVLEPGEVFGHPSLLTGMAPAFTVRAHESSTCYLVPRELAVEALGSPAGVGFVAASLRERLTRAGHTVHGLPELSTVHVSELLGRPLLETTADTPIRDAAQSMTAHGSSAMLVLRGEERLLVTDADLRARVVTGELSADDPVGTLAAPPQAVREDHLAIEAIVQMLEAGVEHLLVQAHDGRPLGIVSASDLMGIEQWSPFALRHAALGARDGEELVAVSGRLRRLFLALLDAGLPPTDIGRVLSLQLDSLRTRWIDFAIEAEGPAPGAWAWLVLGSAARREFTLGSDQENALAYADTTDPDAPGWYARFAARVNEGLERCGFAPDLNRVLAREDRWRMSRAAWLATFRECLVQPDNSHLIRATVSFDFRHGSGGLDIVSPLVSIVREARQHHGFLRLLARTTEEPKPALGFRGSLAVAKRGEESGRLDIKRHGVIPIVNLARFHAIANGITISSTHDRLVAAEELGALDGELGAGLLEALSIVTRIRLQHHAARIEAGAPPDNLVDPDQIPPVSRRELREAFRVVVDAQKRVGSAMPHGR
jgi:CBS domain-containing protein